MLITLPAIVKRPDRGIATALLLLPFTYRLKTIGPIAFPPAEPILLAALIPLLRRPSRSPQLKPIDLAWIAWFAAATASLAASADLYDSLFEWRLCFLEPILLYLGLRLHRRSISPHLILSTWALSGAGTALLSILHYLTGHRVIVDSILPRLAWPYPSPNHLALYLERTLPLQLIFVTTAPDRRTRALYLLGSSISIAALWFTLSRGAWGLGIPTLALTLTALLRKRPAFHPRLIPIVSIALLATLALLLSRATPSPHTELRPLIWKSAWQIFTEHPFLGTGPNGFRYAYPWVIHPEAWEEPEITHAHNVWLDAATRTGIPGLLAWTLLTFCTLSVIRTLRRQSSPPWSIGLSASWAAGLAHGLVDNGYFLFDLALLLAVTTALLTNAQQNLEEHT